MPRLPIDFSAVATFDILPEGEYVGTVESIKYREARSAGKHPQLAVCITVDEPVDLAKRKAWQNVSLSPAAAFRLKKFFAVFGLDEAIDGVGLDIDDETDLLIDPDLAGEPVVFTVKHEMYNGEKQARVEIIEALGVADGPTDDAPEDVPEEPEEEAPPPPPTRRTVTATTTRTASTAPKRRALR